MNKLPILYHKGSSGALFQWRVWTDGESVLTEFGQVGGKLQTTVGKRCHPTNIGRANERSSHDQAESEAQSMHEFKLSRKYRLSPEEAEAPRFLPMLAHPIEKCKDPTFPADTQVKLDGVRCMAYLEDGVVTLMSRSGKPYRVPHIEEALRELLDPGDVFDGELYRLGLSCQTITSLVKRVQPDSLKIQYHVYDMPSVAGIDTLPWTERYEAYIKRLLHSGRKSVTSPVQTVDAKRQNSLSDVQSFQRYCVEQGYEGAMYRALDAVYEWGHRSRNLLKVKTFDDREDLVIGARAGEGKMANAVVFRCQTPEGKAYDVSMACPMEGRERYWREHQQYIGKKLTLRHFGLTDDGIPRFPTGRVFRDDKDLG
jgi:ATP-dependent DNA ligase